MSISGQLSELKAGVQAELPLLVGVVPFGMIYGVLALAAGLRPLEAQAMSLIIFAGSAQFITTQLVSTSAPGLVIILTATVVNLRHALYSASIAPYIRKLRPAWKILLAYLLTDEAYAVSIVHYSDANADQLEHRHWFFLGSGLTLWLSWQLSTAVGIFLGALIPTSWSLDFTLPLIFIALVVPRINNRAGVLAALCSGGAALIAINLPYKLSLVVAALVGILAGFWFEGKT